MSQITVAFKTDPKVLRQLVPPPLTPNKDSLMFAQVVDFLCSGVGRYYEAHISTHATYDRRFVNFSIYMILDSDVAMGAGREIWGYPKKLGRLTLDTTDDVVRATVERGGFTVIDASMRMQSMMPAEDLGGTTEWVTRKFIPNVALGAPPDVDQLTTTTLTNMQIGDVHCGPATLVFGESPSDRVADIPIKSIEGGYFFESSCALEHGQVLHDYLR